LGKLLNELTPGFAAVLLMLEQLLTVGPVQ
jgi:hypothetical protein